MTLHSDYKNIAQDQRLVEKIVSKVLKDGFCELPHFLTLEMFQKLQLIANESVKEIANKKNEQLENTGAYPLVISEEIFDLCEAIHKKRCELTGQIYTQLVRNKQAVGCPYKDARNTQKTEETEYHYDGAYVNLLIPVLLPKNDITKGNLILFPNLRKKFSSKIVTSIFSEILRRSKTMRKMYGYSEIEYVPGNLYIFFGDISLHGVQPITTGQRLVISINSHW